ncbi:MAG: hypothetical protein KJ749_11245, partial [Planctomycetes bacterium]|nr:hypothetical protein [Planctomycetota bacterium]
AKGCRLTTVNELLARKLPRRLHYSISVTPSPNGRRNGNGSALRNRAAKPTHGEHPNPKARTEPTEKPRRVRRRPS